MGRMWPQTVGFFLAGGSLHLLKDGPCCSLRQATSRPARAHAVAALCIQTCFRGIGPAGRSDEPHRHFGRPDNKVHIPAYATPEQG
jgi:hypothetical protein